jgi:hypothetical protein
LVDASDRGDVEAVEAASKAVEMRIRTSAKHRNDEDRRGDAPLGSIACKSLG